MATPRHFGLSASSVSSAPEVEALISERATMLASVRHHLHRAQQRMKVQADKHRSDHNFNIGGDFVYLKLQPYVQTSLAPRAHQKLSFRNFGPFKIVDKIGSVAYKLDLPLSSVHPVFHVSLLKLASLTKYTISPELPDVDNSLQVLEAVLQRRLHPRQDGTVPQLLIKWSGLDASMATWEDAEAIQQQFPQAPTWGQAGAQWEGDVTAPNLGHPRAAQPARRKVTGPVRRILESLAPNGLVIAVS